jgi:hypothetical protein
MFENEGAMLVHVALVANGVLGCGKTDLLRQFGAVWVVTIRAIHESLIHSMVKGHGELRLLLQMARVAKRRLWLGQQEFGGLGMVGGMAGDAAYVVLVVHGIDGIPVFDGSGVASHTAVVNFFRRPAGKDKDLGLIPSTRDVRGAGAVATLATLVGRSAFAIESGFPVGRLLPAVVDFFVAGLANFSTQIV